MAVWRISDLAGFSAWLFAVGLGGHTVLLAVNTPGTTSASPGSPASENLHGKLLAASGSENWASTMARGWPYPNLEELLLASERAFDALSADEWLEAFAAHARIGQPKPGDEQGSAEQSGVAQAADTELAELATLNADYEQRFGHVFLICASGLSASDMLAALRERISNPAPTEFANAQREQRKITALRLRSGFGP
jgi:2-oxo-4-hydroxy-4-carboxy-5-ureidoimidazoline decarboxylase